MKNLSDIQMQPIELDHWSGLVRSWVAANTEEMTPVDRIAWQRISELVALGELKESERDILSKQRFKETEK